MTTLKTKLQLRRHFREIRQQISDSYRKDAAYAAAELFIKLPVFKESKHIACYLPVKDEFDSQSIIEAIWQANKCCYLPVLTSKDESSLMFIKYQDGDPLHLNHYSIPEPANLSAKIAVESLDLVITPLVAFDLYGHRLGTGGGYYDRTFAFLHLRDKSKPCLLGLAYAAQQAKLVQSDPWDISLCGIITEKEYIPIT